MLYPISIFQLDFSYTNYGIVWAIIPYQNGDIKEDQKVEFTCLYLQKNTEEYKQIRQQQSLKYQIMYNTYKIIYRTCYFSFLFVFLSFLVYIGEEGFPVSSQENTLYQLSGGIEELVPFLMGVLALLTFLLLGLLYEAGKVLWQSHFYQRYPVKVLLFERDEPILSVKNREEFAIF
ncbi:TPA: hypothetical protein ACGOPE_001314 [Streptococcus suis]